MPDQAAIVVAALRMDGMRLRVPDAPAVGKAIVASTRRVAGPDIVDGEHLDAQVRAYDLLYRSSPGGTVDL